MAMSNWNSDYSKEHYMEQMMRAKESQMEEKMRYMQAFSQNQLMTPPPTPWTEAMEAQPATPKKSKHLNPKLLLTKGA